MHWVEGKLSLFTYRFAALLIECWAGNLRCGRDKLVVDIYTAINGAVVVKIIFKLSRLQAKYKMQYRKLMGAQTEIFLSSTMAFLLFPCQLFLDQQPFWMQIVTSIAVCHAWRKYSVLHGISLGKRKIPLKYVEHIRVINKIIHANGSCLWKAVTWSLRTTLNFHPAGAIIIVLYTGFTNVFRYTEIK